MSIAKSNDRCCSAGLRFFSRTDQPTPESDMNFTSSQIAVTRARHIVKRASRLGGKNLGLEINRAVAILVAAGADFNAAIGFTLSVRRSMRAA